MQLIEKIEIKSFRSFGNQKKNKTQIIDLKDLNIFSGGNDSGKSNILRALNLFFNQKTNLEDFIDFNKDFFKPEKRFEKYFIAEEMITIKLFFWNKKNAGFNANNAKSAKLPEHFWVSRKWTKSSTFTSYNQESGVINELKKEKGDLWKYCLDDKGNIKSNIRANISKQLTDFLNSIQYHYVPAIKDKAYFAHLYGELQKTLLKEYQSEVNSTKNNFENALQKSTKDLMEEFSNVVNNKNYNISAAFELPDLINLFKTLNVQTGNDISLNYRGDGIQAKLIPEILYFIALKEQQFKQTKIVKGEKVKKYFLWGFEEPENSYEYKNLRLLADRFVEVFAKSSQIFITTHSKEFLSLQSKHTEKELAIINNKKLKKSVKSEKLNKLSGNDTSAKISLYRVWKSENTFNASQIVRFNDSTNEWENIAVDLGLDDSFIIQESRLVEQLQKEIQRQKVLFENEVQNKTYLDGEKLTFAEITELWIEKYAKIKYAPATLKPCLARLKDRIIPELGHHKLSKIQTYHLEEFYNKLRNNGSRLEDFYTPTIIMSEFLSKYTIAKLQQFTGITAKTCKRIKGGQKTNFKTAQKICDSFDLDFNKMFKMTNEKPLSDKTIKNHHTDISAIFSLAERWELISSNPAKKVDLGKISKKQVKYYDDIQTAKLFKELENESLTYRTMISLALDVGLRSGELCGLKWEDVNFETRILTINKQRQYVSTYGVMERPPKTENGNRIVTLSSQMLSMLKIYKQKQAEDKLKLGSAWKNGEYLFKHDNGEDLHPTRPYKWFMNFLKRHNLPKITFHELRHTNASLLIANGVDAVTLSKRLGHGDKTVTLNTYSHAIQSKETLAASTMDNLYSALKKKCL